MRPSAGSQGSDGPGRRSAGSRHRFHKASPTSHHDLAVRARSNAHNATGIRWAQADSRRPLARRTKATLFKVAGLDLGSFELPRSPVGRVREVPGGKVDGRKWAGRVGPASQGVKTDATASKQTHLQEGWALSVAVALAFASWASRISGPHHPGRPRPTGARRLLRPSRDERPTRKSLGWRPPARGSMKTRPGPLWEQVKQTIAGGRSARHARPPLANAPRRGRKRAEPRRPGR